MNGISARHVLAQGRLNLFLHISILSLFLLALAGCGSQEHGMLATSGPASTCPVASVQKGARPVNFYSVIL